MKTKLFKSKNEETIKFPLNKFFFGGGGGKKQKTKIKTNCRHRSIKLFDCVFGGSRVRKYFENFGREFTQMKSK